MRESPIHPVGLAAARRLAALHARCFTPSWTARDITGLLKGRGVGALLAGEPEHPTADRGLALYRAVADEAEILTICVVPAARRTGAGRALLTAVETRCREAGAATLFLEVAVSNAAARALYHGAGYVEIARRAAYYERDDGVREDALVLRRNL